MIDGRRSEELERGVGLRWMKTYGPIDILLVNPGWRRRFDKRGLRFNRPWPPLSLLVCAAQCEQAGLRVQVIDGRADKRWQVRLNRLCGKAAWIGLTTSPLDRWQCPNLDLDFLVTLARSLPREKLFLMGAHGSLFPEVMLKATGARGVLVGEPENRVPLVVTRTEWTSVPGLVFRRDGRFCRTPRAEPVDLARLPAPAYHLVTPGDYGYELLGKPMALLETSRGCPHRCRFCLKVMYGPGLRLKPADKVLSEVEELAKHHSVRYVYFMDLEFTASRAHAIAVCRALEKGGNALRWCCQTRADAVDRELLRHMYRAGCRLVHFGVEAGAPHILRSTGKGMDHTGIARGVRLARQAGMRVACFFLLGFPGESPAQMWATLALARRLRPDYLSFHAVTPYPGTALRRERAQADESLSQLFPATCQGQSPDFLRRMIRRGYISFYLDPRQALRILRHGDRSSMLSGVRLLLDVLHA